MEQVPDEMFSEKMLGDGFAILPSGESVFSPIEGEIISIYKGSNHCYGIRGKDGLEILIHVGIDTVSLNNNAIIPHVILGERVQANQLIATVDLNKVRSSNLQLHTMTVITNMERVKSFTLSEKKEVSHGDEIFSYALA
ncbi:PTS sugar transporter subunit IIA [Testudinibacter sp. P27/CKL/0425]